MFIRFPCVALLSALLLAAAPAPASSDGSDGGTIPTVVKEPHYGEILYYFYQQDYFPAIVRLLAARDQSQLDDHGAEAELLLGGLYLSYGQHQHAAQIFERLLADHTDSSVRDRTWFFLARIWHQRGYLDEAQQALANISDELPGSMEAEKVNLLAQLLIESGDHGGAIELLARWEDKTEWARYARFNLGVALARSGQVDAAKALLDELGQLDPWNDELSALRDKANLALGYALLQDGQPAAAKRPLQRVRLEGPFSSKALLGAGWADAEDERYERALVPWMELRGRSLLDPAVQESMLAVPYAMAKLESISQAADFYLDAIEAFYEEGSRIDLAIGELQSGKLLEEFLYQDASASTGWHWSLANLPRGTESQYLYHLLATHEFQEGLKNYRDLDYLARNLETWQDNLDVYGNMLATRMAAYDTRLPQVQDSLARADLERMVDEKLDFDARVARIAKERDTLALATDEEFALWGEIASVEQTPALQADIPEAVDARRRVRLMKGVLIWELDKEFRERLWRVERNLNQTGAALVEAQRARRQIDRSMRTEPGFFRDFGKRIDSLNPRIDSLLARVDDARARQHVYLQNIAIGEMRAQKERLNTYTVQARFALAAIYDLSSTVGSAAQ
ncbi:MAG: tetratricopeptide repeat protein [Woeseia sp.]